MCIKLLCCGGSRKKYGTHRPADTAGTSDPQYGRSRPAVQPFFTNDTVRNMGSLPHPTIQKFSVITVAVVGASRRFLSQITRHQNEVKFTSASLQYSNYSGEAGFVKPYEILTAPPDIQKLYEQLPVRYGLLRAAL